jgi:UDP-4-amino-4-deoxy-L-arabinose-oxoglutarate aminotransferase
VSFEWGSGTISLPLYPSLSVDKQEYVIRILRDQVVPMIENANMMVPNQARG